MYISSLTKPIINKRKLKRMIYNHIKRSCGDFGLVRIKYNKLIILVDDSGDYEVYRKNAPHPYPWFYIFNPANELNFSEMV